MFYTHAYMPIYTTITSSQHKTAPVTPQPALLMCEKQQTNKQTPVSPDTLLKAPAPFVPRHGTRCMERCMDYCKVVSGGTRCE